MADPLDLAWAAGFFDGEGTIGIYWHTKSRGRPGGWYSLMISVAQKDRRPLDRFQTIVGDGRIYARAKAWAWVCDSARAADVLATIVPFLRTNKREQAILALSFQVQMGHGRVVLSEEELAEKKSYADQIKSLKQEGNFVGA